MGSKLGAYIQSKKFLQVVKELPYLEGREKIVEETYQYFDNNPNDVQLIIDNFNLIQIQPDNTLLQKTYRELGLHYYEKLFCLVKQGEAREVIDTYVDYGDVLDFFKRAKKEGKAVFLGQSHIGASYFLPVVFMVNNMDIISVGYFPDPVGKLLETNSAKFTKTYQLGAVNLVNLANSNVSSPSVMIQGLKRGEFVMNVFDENNALCKPVKLFNATIYGGAGMDKVLRNFSGDDIYVVTPFLLRTKDGYFKFEIDHHSLDSENIIQDFFHSYEKRIEQYPEQWYFVQEIHENLERKTSVGKE